MIPLIIQKLENPDNLRCGKPEMKEGREKMDEVIQSDEIQKVQKDVK